jgi:hypothetical protein
MSDLLDTIDAAAAILLDAAGFGAKVEGVEPAKIELPERVKAFQAVVEWAKTRNVLKPPERGKTRFDDIKRQFGEAPKRRGRRSEAESSSEPAPAAEPPNGVDLFDA